MPAGYVVRLRTIGAHVPTGCIEPVYVVRTAVSRCSTFTVAYRPVGLREAMSTTLRADCLAFLVFGPTAPDRIHQAKR